MATVSKFNSFPQALLQAVHNFSGHTFKALLSNTLPLATHTVKADVTELGAGNGYSAGGVAVGMAVSLSGGTAKVTASDAAITAAGGAIGPFRYVVFYNDTATGDPLIGWSDYGSAVSIPDGDTFNIRFDSTDGLFTLA